MIKGQTLWISGFRASDLLAGNEVPVEITNCISTCNGVKFLQGYFLIWGDRRQMIQLAGKNNRIELNLTALPMGLSDVCIVLTGGEAHLGAVTVAHSGVRLETINIDHHLEHTLTKELGELLNKELTGTFAICCGIHYDNITKQEIADVIEIARRLVMDMCSQIKNGKNIS